MNYLLKNTHKSVKDSKVHDFYNNAKYGNIEF